jgi:S-DNA-T family DNA segregation ATPase FtsK/SpoIIIE
MGENDYQYPDVTLLCEPARHGGQSDDELLDSAARLAQKLSEFGVAGQIKHICPGPVITTYEFKPDPGVRYSRVAGLAEDLCLALGAESVRVSRLPGKPHVGIEVSNRERDNVPLRGLIEARPFRESPPKLTAALGVTTDGMGFVLDLAKLPNLLIAGATGTGKSVCVNSIIISILYKARPDEVKFILIDTKGLELGLYDGIPHLAAPVITDAARASTALRWAVGQMERRQQEMSRWGVRDIEGFNEEVARRNVLGDLDVAGEPWKTLPYIVVVIDEIADLVDSGYEIEEPLTRLAQTARSAGIHLTMATQRPSADVVAGIIKAGFPARVSFKVSSKGDSRIVLDGGGAERLLGRGDMLFLSPDNPSPVRVHGAFVGDAEVRRVAQHVRVQGEPVYAIPPDAAGEGFADGREDSGRDELFEQALRVCVEMRRASTSVIQRRLRIGYGRAAAILDEMEREGFIGNAEGERPRPVLSRAYETVGRWDEAGEMRVDTGLPMSSKESSSTSTSRRERGVRPEAEDTGAPLTRDAHGLATVEMKQPFGRSPWLIGGIILLLALLVAVYYKAFY